MVSIEKYIKIYSYPNKAEMQEEDSDQDYENEKYNNNAWNISLNIIFQSIPATNRKMIGKNIMFYGNIKYHYCYKDITIVGNGRIYNEVFLWTKMLNASSAPLIKLHPLVIVVELYKKFGFEKTLDMLEGEFSFLLFDMNIHGEECVIYIVKDSFGLCPMYQWMNTSTTNSQKKVQFYNDTVIDTHQYLFSSSNLIQTTDNMIMEPIQNGTYLMFTHSFKVSAIWKFKNTFHYYTLPFHSTYTEEEGREEEAINKQIEIAINKRIQYILYKENAFYNDKLETELETSENINEIQKAMMLDYITKNKKIKIGIIMFEEKNNLSYQLFEYLVKNEIKYNTKLECKLIDFVVDKNSIEEKYPTIIQKLKYSLQNNDPSIIRAYFIPLMLAKHISEVYPDIKYVFMGEPFVYKWIFANVYDRRYHLNDSFFLENIKGWVGAFFKYNIELIIPYLDRILIQKI